MKSLSKGKRPGDEVISCDFKQMEFWKELILKSMMQKTWIWLMYMNDTFTYIQKDI